MLRKDCPLTAVRRLRSEMDGETVFYFYCGMWGLSVVAWFIKPTNYRGVSINGGTPKSSNLMGFSLINQPFWGTPIYGTPHSGKYHKPYSDWSYVNPNLAISSTGPHPWMPPGAGCEGDCPWPIFYVHPCTEACIRYSIYAHVENIMCIYIYISVCVCIIGCTVAWYVKI